MVKCYQLSPLAEADLEEIWLYTFKHWSMAQADSYQRNLVKAFEGLAAGTKTGRPSVLENIQKYLCGSHVVYFVEHKHHLDVVRVLHQRQDVERHL